MDLTAGPPACERGSIKCGALRRTLEAQDEGQNRDPRGRRDEALANCERALGLLDGISTD